jgi:uncharacterized coiled-coil protein SlyX
MDNTEDTALNQNVGEEANVSTTPVEEPKAPVEETKPEGEVATEPKEEESKEEVPAKKGAEARIRELNSRAKSAEEKVQSLSEQLENLTRGVTPQGNQPYTPQVAPGNEISPEQYQSDVVRAADGLVQIRLNQFKIVENINREASLAIKDHPELDPESDQFDKELNDSVTEATLAYAKSNPTGSVRKFVDKLMKPYKRSLTKEVAKESEIIAKQVSQTALRPTPSKNTEKSHQDKSIEELEKELGVVY